MGGMEITLVCFAVGESEGGGHKIRGRELGGKEEEEEEERRPLEQVSGGGGVSQRIYWRNFRQLAVFSHPKVSI